MEQAVADRRRLGWLQLLARSQEDGGYLVRPFGGLPLVYRTDPPTKDRIFRFAGLFNAWSLWAVLLLVIATFPITLDLWTDQLWWATAICAGIAYVLLLAFWSIGALITLRHATRVPVAAWSDPKGVARQTNWWRTLLVWAAIAAGLVGVGPLAQGRPVFPWLWLATGLVVALLVFVIREHLRRQVAPTAPGATAAPPPIVDPLTRRRRVLLGALLAPLANPFLLMMIGGSVVRRPDLTHDLRFFGMFLAASYGWGLVLCVFLLLGRGRSGIKWHLVAATLATLVLAPALLGLIQQPGINDVMIWVSVVATAAITYPIALAHWLIVRPERYA
jgi:hypothetical protein